MKRLIYIFLVFTMQCYAQNYEWINLTNGDKVTAIISSGNNLWIGTDGGLVKLNKSNDSITFYNRANANLPDNHIRTLAIDSAGYLWIGTQYSGIGKFDGSMCQVFNTTNSQLPHDQWNTEIEVDHEGNIWIGSFRYISKFDEINWIIYETGDPISAYFSINDIKFNKNDGSGWIGASWGLGKLSNDSLYQKYDGFSKEILAIQFDTLNTVWLGTHWNGLFKYDGINWTVYDTSNSSIPSNNIYDMKFDKNGNLWMATNNGLVKFDGTNWEIFNTTNSGLLENAILSIEIDENGIIWIGFFNYGLMKFDGTNWKKYQLSNSILPCNYIYAIEVDKKKSVWFGTYKGLIKQDRGNWTLYDSSNSGLVTTYHNNIEIHALESDSIIENLWIGFKGKPLLFKYDGQNWLKFDSSNSPFTDGFINCLRIDVNNNLWIGAGLKYGLVKFDGINWNIYNTQNTNLTSNVVSDIEFDRNGNLWLALRYIAYKNNDGQWIVYEGGLAKFDGNTWIVFNKYNSGLPYNNVKSMAFDSSGILWISTWHTQAIGIEYGGGLTKYDGNNWTTYNIYNSPLTSNTIFDIKIDKNNYLWLSTCEGGLVKYDGINNWVVFNKLNSGIAFNSMSVVEIDSFDNKWIGHNESGLSIFREGGIITNIKETYIAPIRRTFTLHQNYPNPFNPTTKIKYAIKEQGLVALKVYDILGREVETLLNEPREPGKYEIELNADKLGLSSGVYFYLLRSGPFSATKKFVYLR